MHNLQSYRRRHLSPALLPNYYRNHPSGAAMMSFPPGLGKTHLILGSFQQLREQFSRIYYAASQHCIINEILPHVRHLPHEIKKQRDTALCGQRRAGDWQHLYRLNLSQMGKWVICRGCPNREVCEWYAPEKVDNPFLIIETQDHLFKDKSPPAGSLTILDELKFLEFSILKQIDRNDLEKFWKILLRYPDLHNLTLMTSALLADRPLDRALLRSYDDKQARSQLHKAMFRFHCALSANDVFNLGPLVEAACTSTTHSLGSAIYFNKRPVITGALLVAGYGANRELLEYYFARPFHDLTPTERFVHPGSKFYQLNSTSAALFKFTTNPRARAGILRMAAAKIEANRKENKKTLLIAKKAAIKMILNELPNFFRSPSPPLVQLFTRMGDQDIDGVNVIPLLHYGVEGINYFESYECVICLTAYNLPAGVVSERLRQLGAGLDVTVEIRNSPNLGRVVVTEPTIPWAPHLFDYLERHKILQTVCRARPFTTPTEIILAGRQDLGADIVFDDVRYLATALQIGSRIQKVQTCRTLLESGLSEKDAARHMNVSIRTISRYKRELKKGVCLNATDKKA